MWRNSYASRPAGRTRSRSSSSSISWLLAGGELRLERHDPGRAERATEDRAELEDPTVRRRQEVEPGQDRRLDRVGQVGQAGLDGGVVVEVRHPLDDRSGDLAGVERVAVGPRDDARDDRRARCRRAGT